MEHGQLHAIVDINPTSWLTLEYSIVLYRIPLGLHSHTQAQSTNPPQLLPPSSFSRLIDTQGQITIIWGGGLRVEEGALIYSRSGEVYKSSYKEQ